MDANDPSDSSNKSCPKCGKVYADKEISYCYYDGSKLVAGGSSKQLQSKMAVQEPSENLFDDFGFEIDLKNSNHLSNIPLALMQSTTSLLQPNVKLPAIIENVTSPFFSIPSPKPRRNFFAKRIKHSGLSDVNLYGYLLTFLFVSLIYTFWLYRAYIEPYNITIASITPDMFIIAFFLNIVLTFIMVFPLVSLGYSLTNSVMATKKDFRLKIESSTFIFSIILNFLIFRLGWPLPIIVIPGEPKIRGVPPLKVVAKAIRNGFIPGFFIILLSFGALQLINYFNLQVSIFLLLNLEIFLLFSLSTYFLMLMPFKNALGKLIQKDSPTVFYTIFLTVFAFLISLLSIIHF